MDQIQIGQFIKALRKEKNLTQREVAERLNISEKTVSKWETANGLPEVSLMLPLCELLEISVNELLSGERLNENKYKNKAEQNIMRLMEEKAETEKKIIMSAIISAITVLASAALVLLAGLLEMPIGLRIFLVILAIVIVGTGIGLACVLDQDAGTFECPHCGEKFVPSMKAYIMGVHTITRRRLKCPKCNKTGFCKKRLGK